MRKFIFAGLVLIAAGVVAFMLNYKSKQIDEIGYFQNDHPNWPIMQISAEFNDVRIGFKNSLVKEGRGDVLSVNIDQGGHVLYLDESEHLVLSVNWVEMLSNLGWRAELTVPIDIIPTYEMQPGRFTVLIYIMFGRRGELQLTTRQGEVLIETCGTRAPELDKDYRDQIPIDQMFEWAYKIEDGPPPVTNCSDPEE